MIQDFNPCFWIEDMSSAFLGALQLLGFCEESGQEKKESEEIKKQYKEKIGLKSASIHSLWVRYAFNTRLIYVGFIVWFGLTWHIFASLNLFFLLSFHL